MTEQELELWHAKFAAASMERMMKSIVAQADRYARLGTEKLAAVKEAA